MYTLPSFLPFFLPFGVRAVHKVFFLWTLKLVKRQVLVVSSYTVFQHTVSPVLNFVGGSDQNSLKIVHRTC